MKKIFALLLIAVCTLSMVACDGGEELAREAVEGYMEALVNLDYSVAKDYIDDPSVLDGVSSYDTESIMAQLPEEFDAYKEKFKNAIDALIEKGKSAMSYEITETTEVEDGFVFDVTMTLVEDTFTDPMSNGEMMNEALTAMIEEGKITEDMTEDEIINAVFDEMLVFIDNMEVATQEITKEIFVYEKDGKWVIDTDETVE